MSKTFIALDLEMNQPSGRIIEVGIAIGDRNTPESLFKKSWLVSPGEPLSPEIVALTGITDQMIAEQAVTWETLARELGTLLETHRPFVNPVTWGGGDSTLLLESLRGQGISFRHFGRRWLDVKTMHMMLAFSRNSAARGGLGSVMRAYGLAFEGTPHRADVDALNTLKLFFWFLERQRNLEKSGKST